MAKPIEFCTELTGEDALNFHRYMENPDATLEGRELIREAVRLLKKSTNI
jgi:hypothetical protein